MIRKFLNLFEFFKSAFAINFAISLASILFGGIKLFSGVFLSLGFILSVLIKEVNYKNYFIFYYNNGFSKVQLWVVCYLFNFVFLIVFAGIYNFIETYFG